MQWRGKQNSILDLVVNLCDCDTCLLTWLVSLMYVDSISYENLPCRLPGSNLGLNEFIYYFVFTLLFVCLFIFLNKKYCKLLACGQCRLVKVR